jgi:extracellular elastinolytic metalloproteinase
MTQFGESIPHAADPSEYTAEDALLRFMHLASTDDKSRADIRHKFDDHKKGMYIERPGQLLGTGAEYYFIHNVPGAVSPVKGRLAYVQVVEGEETVLRLVHKVSDKRWLCEP